MEIPIRCYSCNNTLASKWQKYKELVATYRRLGNVKSDKPLLLSVETLNEPTPEAKAFRDLGIERICCKQNLMTQIELG